MHATFLSLFLESGMTNVNYCFTYFPLLLSCFLDLNSLYKDKSVMFGAPTTRITLESIIKAYVLTQYNGLTEPALTSPYSSTQVKCGGPLG